MLQDTYLISHWYAACFSAKHYFAAVNMCLVTILSRYFFSPSLLPLLTISTIPPSHVAFDKNAWKSVCGRRTDADAARAQEARQRLISRLPDAKKSWPPRCKPAESNERISECKPVSRSRTGKTSCESEVKRRVECPEFPGGMKAAAPLIPHRYVHICESSRLVLACVFNINSIASLLYPS